MTLFKKNFFNFKLFRIQKYYNWRADVITFPTREHRRRHRIRDASAEARTRERPWRSLRSLVTDNTANETSTTNIYIYIYSYTCRDCEKKGKKRKKERNVLLTLGHLFFFSNPPLHNSSKFFFFFSFSILSFRIFVASTDFPNPIQPIFNI